MCIQCATFNIISTHKAPLLFRSDPVAQLLLFKLSFSLSALFRGFGAAYADSHRHRQTGRQTDGQTDKWNRGRQLAPGYQRKVNSVGVTRLEHRGPHHGGVCKHTTV